MQSVRPKGKQASTQAHHTPIPPSLSSGGDGGVTGPPPLARMAPILPRIPQDPPPRLRVEAWENAKGCLAGFL